MAEVGGVVGRDAARVHGCGPPGGHDGPAVAAHVVHARPLPLAVAELGWLDSLTAVIVPGAAGAFGVFFLRQFFVSLPHELEEAALLDGANRFQIFRSLTLLRQAALDVTLEQALGLLAEPVQAGIVRQRAHAGRGLRSPFGHHTPPFL